MARLHHAALPRVSDYFTEDGRAFLVMQFTGWKPVFNSVGIAAVSVAISAVIWWLFARVMTAKTVKGARTRVAVLGFQEFMNRVDAERFFQGGVEIVDEYRQTRDVVHVRMGDDDVFNFGSLLVSQSNGDAAGINCHAVVD